MPLTLISHFWNEAFLLPYWLRHHYPLFDHGVLLDYGSTDGSAELVKELAPGWEVRRSRNECFDARDVDAEVMDVEREFAGWKLVLNTTEFVLCHDLALFVRWMEKYRTDVQGIWGFDLVMVDPLAERDTAVTDRPLHFQKRWGYHPGGERSRILHRRPDGQYNTGRHSSGVVDKKLDDGFFVLWFGWSPMRNVTGRKLQIQERIPPRDRAARLGWHHIVTAAELESRYSQETARAYDLWERHPNYRELLAYPARKEGVMIDGLTAIEASTVHSLTACRAPHA
jgi:Glycosyl transferase family 2